MDSPGSDMSSCEHNWLIFSTSNYAKLLYCTSFSVYTTLQFIIPVYV